ncbi:PTS system mannose/fructose/sorbose family transporter subunit IID [Lacrimispora sp. BS-2]|uniref:PTS system mannose/fructose/sorbose family transporter subunit IID n=1 Tax=Lacrimispora sp. BS-2 TaxID=3151850 RepID=A0AAU7PT39_9FIRM
MDENIAAANENNEKKLRKSDLLRCFLIWETTSESCLSYERLMSLGFCHAMTPVINRLYKTKEERASALKRHMVFFNTENNWGAFIPGIVCSMEEERANEGTISEEMINSVKIGLMGPLAGIGDTITQGLFKTVLLAIFVDMTLKGSIAAPFIYAILMGIYIGGMGYFTFFSGYRLGQNVLGKITDVAIMKKITNSLSILGLIIAGAMMVNNVSIVTPLAINIGKTSVVIQDLLDSILPGMLSVIFVMLCFGLMKKRVSVFKIMIILFAVAIIAALFGIL